ncbi:MAG: hypothetical protein K2G74_01660, partial [Muribaculaceae bacterium]|nr:hypothetical protein [Muribaculaceae bacterium]
MSKIDKKLITKFTKWFFLGLLSLIILLAVLLYIPFVQDFAVKKALNQINSKGDMTMSVSRLRLKFPLTLEVKDFVMVQKADTMIL